MSASFDDRTQLTDELAVQYGFTLNSISFLDHLNYASPYARLTYTLGDYGEIAFAYTSGDARPDLAGKGRMDADLQRDLNTLGLFPRISLRDGRAQIQRGQNFELTYTRKVGSRTYQVSTYRENVSNAALVPGGARPACTPAATSSRTCSPELPHSTPAITAARATPPP